uniref:Uncharacterized protein n=1 Tax=Anguilla anguilla TaxID=7936 RepID=A0A0E9Q621_ANGAN
MHCLHICTSSWGSTRVSGLGLLNL